MEAVIKKGNAITMKTFEVGKVYIDWLGDLVTLESASTEQKGLKPFVCRNNKTGRLCFYHIAHIFEVCEK